MKTVQMLLRETEPAFRGAMADLATDELKRGDLVLFRAKIMALAAQRRPDVTPETTLDVDAEVELTCKEYAEFLAEFQSIIARQ